MAAKARRVVRFIMTGSRWLMRRGGADGLKEGSNTARPYTTDPGGVAVPWPSRVGAALPGGSAPVDFAPLAYDGLEAG